MLKSNKPAKVQPSEKTSVVAQGPKSLLFGQSNFAKKWSSPIAPQVKRAFWARVKPTLKLMVKSWVGVASSSGKGLGTSSVQLVGSPVASPFSLVDLGSFVGGVQKGSPWILGVQTLRILSFVVSSDSQSAFLSLSNLWISLVMRLQQSFSALGTLMWVFVVRFLTLSSL